MFTRYPDLQDYKYRKALTPTVKAFQIKNQPKHMNFYDTLKKLFFIAIYYRTTTDEKTLPQD
jgi:hypothetical protein